MSVDEIMKEFNILGKRSYTSDQENMNRRRIADDELKELEISPVLGIVDLSVNSEKVNNKCKIESSLEEILTRFEYMENNFLNKEVEVANS